MEDNANYTYTYQREKSRQAKKRALMIALILFGLILIAVILIGVLSGRDSAVKKYEKEVAALQAEQTTLAPSTAAPTEEVSPYKEGEFTVSTGGYALKFRKDHTMNADVYLEIQENTKLTITEIYHDTAAASTGSDIEYWGKTTYKGYTGWVAMNYLKKAYSNSVVTPEELSSQETTAAPSTEASTEPTTVATTVAPTEATTQTTTTAPAETTQAATAAAAYSVGNYTVSTEGSTLNFRADSSIDSPVLMSIPDGTAVTVTAVVESNGSYWGKIDYQGYTGFVSMDYLVKVS